MKSLAPLCILLLLTRCTPDPTLTDSEALTETERQVQARIEEDGIHVVHFWAPWCGNSRSELRAGLREVIAANEDVTFTFVTIWNSGEVGHETLDYFSIPDRVLRLAQPDHGPSTHKPNRRTTFLGLPLSWTPTTWIFHRNGQLAYAVNYGELTPETFQILLDATRADWSHD